MRTKCHTDECFNKTRNEDGICDDCNEKKERKKIIEKENRKRYDIIVISPDGKVETYKECTSYAYYTYKGSSSAKFIHKNELHSIIVGGGMVQVRKYYKE